MDVFTNEAIDTVLRPIVHQVMPYIKVLVVSEDQPLVGVAPISPDMR